MRQVILWLLGGAIVVHGLYWLIWLTDRDLLANEHRGAYYDFEDAQPLAEVWFGLACLCALVSMLRRMPAALFWLIAAGSGGLYLFAIDVLYDAQHDGFTAGGRGGVELAIVAGTFAFAVTVLAYAWTRRVELLAGRRTTEGQSRT